MLFLCVYCLHCLHCSTRSCDNERVNKGGQIKNSAELLNSLFAVIEKFQLILLLLCAFFITNTELRNSLSDGVVASQNF